MYFAKELIGVKGFSHRFLGCLFGLAVVWLICFLAGRCDAEAKEPAGSRNILRLFHGSGVGGNGVIYKEYAPNEYIVFSSAHLCHGQNLINHIYKYAEERSAEEVNKYLADLLKNVIRKGHFCAMNATLETGCTKSVLTLMPVYINFKEDIAIFRTMIPAICGIKSVSVDPKEKYEIKTEIYIPFSFLLDNGGSLRSINFDRLGFEMDSNGVQVGGNNGAGMSGSGVYNLKTEKLIGIYRAYYKSITPHYVVGRMLKISRYIEGLKSVKNFKKVQCIDQENQTTNCNLVLGTTKELKYVPAKKEEVDE